MQGLYRIYRLLNFGIEIIESNFVRLIMNIQYRLHIAILFLEHMDNMREDPAYAHHSRLIVVSSLNLQSCRKFLKLWKFKDMMIP